MSIKFIPIVASAIFMAFLPVMSSAAQSEIVQSVWIDGHSYDAQLDRNLRFGATEGEHYEGRFPEDPDSWVRISRLDSGWEGLAYAFGRMHTIGGNEKPATFSFSQIGELPQCGMDHLHGQSRITPESLIGPAMAQAVSANYDTLCADKVDGVCLMLELELAFDLQFQERFAKPSEQAGAIMNMVEGFYKDQFGIVFDTLSLTFLDNAQDDVFSKTTVAEDLLSDVSDKRDAGALDFLKSDRSIFHFVSGRDFNGGTAGMAWVGSLCGTGRYATGVTNAFDSNAITALVVAHEIGHNLGARHDGQDGEGAACQSGQYIMGPSISANANSFSRCSYDSVTRKISTLGAIERCFNFPADVSLLAVGGNPSEVAQKAPFQANFRIDYQDAGIEKADRIAVGGVIGEGNGRLIGVSLGRTACTLTGSTDKADGFSCPEAAAKTGLTLSVQAEAGTSTTFDLLQSVTLISDSGEVKDILPQNNELVTRIVLAEVEPRAPEEPGNEGTQPSAPDVPASSSSRSDSGGGGAISLAWLLMGVIAVAARRRRFI
ncbi:M12 family metallo-peptidase [Marinobacter xiaoshiensis]|uniref:M12 family metallo-peptidase n=1 Tax=Marinobacter xiaoshiensis TaxID=3073652 RepID=A0ABU2HKU6_9GAMM|nr:M12 family metallo-peptidase [Marinobacter sp. F60267]MDS1311368.1 M12 family metallo-peptidase [Marinobacter sp. F60267]